MLWSLPRRHATLASWLLRVALGAALAGGTAAQAQDGPQREPTGGPAGAPPASAADLALTERDRGPWSPTDFDAARPDLPTLVIAGDSTAATGGPATRGWGAVLLDYFDPARVNIVNRAAAGRSFRTFTAEGRWQQILDRLKPGDFVVIEFGHNDGGGARGGKGRGDVPGIGDETETITRPDGSIEIVHTYGWYARTYVRQARERGATPILSTTTVRNIWRDGRVERGMGQMLVWLHQVAHQEGALLLDHANITADRYEDLGPAAVAKFFPQDHTHTSTAGAVLNAETFIAGLKTLPGEPLVASLNPRGQAIMPHPRGPNWRGYDDGDVSAAAGAFAALAPAGADVPSTAVRRPPGAADGAPSDAPFGLDRRGRPLRFPPGVEPGMPHPEYKPDLPTLWLVGDSTVKEGRDAGLNGGRWGWGHEIGRYFDLTRINVENQALGGTSSRSFRTEGWWDSVREMIRPGDFVLIQFGHNDGGVDSSTPRIKARGTLPGSGDQTVIHTAGDGLSEMVHTYGWYLSQYVADVRAAGATPILCSLVPRNTWRDGRVVRGQDDSYVAWAREVAERERAAFINLNHIACEAMDAMGEDFARGALFRSDDHTHTNLLGAQVNARCVASGIKALTTVPLADYLSPAADSVPPAASSMVRSP
ncbi:MAG TPA: rhamnogalacturonan acetylesterase [Lacipirellulaceae bacterium]|nr:rhamnogalacturonan acetylesterase [Lacipirellulaceae bacterium]